jgi:hypothetical protein
LPVFVSGRSAERLCILYKDEITAKTVQSPLFSYVTFAKVAKIIEITLQIIEILPYYHNKTGFKEENI